MFLTREGPGHTRAGSELQASCLPIATVAVPCPAARCRLSLGSSPRARGHVSVLRSHRQALWTLETQTDAKRGCQEIPDILRNDISTSSNAGLKFL